jgi:2-hydroxychromene-2-carboxylate isomerase
MGKLFSHHRFPGPGEIPAKRNYELKKCFRYAHKNNLAFKPPMQFPFNPLAIIRLATKHASQMRQAEIISFIYKLVWAQGYVLDDPDVVQNLLKEHGFEEAMFERSFAREAKIELKQNINEAIESNIFGVPTFSLDNDFFWGNDSMEDLTNYLTDHDNWDKELYNKLKT